MAEAHCNLGNALRSTGQFAAARESLARGHELGSKRPDWNYDSQGWLDTVDQLIAAEEGLEELLAGSRSATPIETLEFAHFAHGCRRHVAAARLYARGFEEPPQLGLGFELELRFEAARSAALAAAGSSRDARDAALDEPDEWRHLALELMTTALARLGAAWDAEEIHDAEAVRAALSAWREDAELTALSPHDERAWSRLWTEIDARLSELP
jgi:hypothetical protein